MSGKTEFRRRCRNGLARASSVGVRWHLIGHLQRNKAKALPRFDLFHALDSDRLADAVNASAGGRSPVRALMQVNVVGEASKGGFSRTSGSGSGESAHDDRNRRPRRHDHGAARRR
jgi:uncharacterized pyridoxal phosphate-containing UPF0001 family protein